MTLKNPHTHIQSLGQGKLRPKTKMSSEQLDKNLWADSPAAKAALESERGPGEKEAFNMYLLLYANFRKRMGRAMRRTRDKNL